MALWSRDLAGSRQIATLLTELKRTGKKLGVCSMCIGPKLSLDGPASLFGML